MLKPPFSVLRKTHFFAGEIPWQSASWASGRIFSTASRSNITMSSSLPAPPRSLGAWLGRVVANTWGIKKIYLRHQKKTYSPGIPCFLWPLQQFGDKTEHFYAICIVLEVEPLARKVFAGRWTWKSSIRRARRCRFDSTCNTLEFEPFIFDCCFETYAGLKFVYVWFRVDLGLVWSLFQVGLESNYGWLRLV